MERGRLLRPAARRRTRRRRGGTGLRAAMTLISSLRGRIFLASALLAGLSIGAAIYVVNQRATGEAQRSMQREIPATVVLVVQLRKTRIATYTGMARLIADLPKLKAAV